jgi:hypothetical protein
MTRTWSYTAGGIGYISSGAARKSGGAYRVVDADMAAIRTELIALGAAAQNPSFYVSDYNNGQADAGLIVQWDRGNAGFVEQSTNLYLNASLAVDHAVSSESAALVTYVLPGWLAHKNQHLGFRARASKASGTDTFTLNIKCNGTTVRTTTVWTNFYLQVAGSMISRNATNSWERFGNASGPDFVGGTSGAVPVIETYDQTAGLTFTVTLNRNVGSTDTATLRYLQIWREI